MKDTKKAMMLHPGHLEFEKNKIKAIQEDKEILKEIERINDSFGGYREMPPSKSKPYFSAQYKFDKYK